MKRKLLTWLLLAAMLVSIVPAAFAQENAPTVKSFSVTIDGSEYTSDSENGTIKVLGSTPIRSEMKFSITFSEAVKFVQSYNITTDSTDPLNPVYVPENDIPSGALYVSTPGETSATVNMNLKTGSFNFNSSAYSLTLTTSDNGVTWTGEAPVGVLGDLTQLTLFTLVNNLINPAMIMADSVESVASQIGNATNNIIFNRDDQFVYIRQGGPNVTIDTVTFVCLADTFKWKLPEGSLLEYPSAPTFSGMEFDNWYTDSSFTNPVPADQIVSNGLTVYAKYNYTSTTDFEKALENQNQTVVEISTPEEFSIFASRAGIMNPGRRVHLAESLDLGGSTFTAIQFNANFDGGGHTLSNATFQANGENSGMFAIVGKGQKIANVTLSNIKVENAQNAGIVAGSVTSGSGDATQTERPLIQNVRVIGGEVTGRNSAGIAGNTFLADIQFCSVTGTKISGLVNAGGIASQSYSNINNCYTKDIALSGFLYKGGIVTTMLEASSTTYCWTTYENVVDPRRHNDGVLDVCIANADKTTGEDAEVEGFDTEYWNLADNLANSTFTDQVYYSF